MDWVLNAWFKIVKPEFAKFRKAIADQTADIPPTFFETKGAAHGNRNPLFLFLRPKKLLYIALASAQGKASQKKQNSLEKILTDYRIEWDSSLTELQTRLNHISAVSQSRHLIQQLCEEIYCLGDKGGINSDWHGRYKDHYLQACESFSDIPWLAEKEKHDAKNLREQIKIALGRAPKEKQQRKKRVSGDERGKRNYVVQKIIDMQKAAQEKGLKKVSVATAIQRLKNDAAWRQRIASLKLKDNTIKALVRDAWATIRSKKVSL